MTKTIDYDLTSAYQEIADSTNDTSVTVYNPTSYTVGIVVDERTEATRISEGDAEGIILIPPGDDKFFSGFTGKITAKHMTSNTLTDCKIIVTKS